MIDCVERSLERGRRAVSERIAPLVGICLMGLTLASLPLLAAAMQTDDDGWRDLTASARTGVIHLDAIHSRDALFRLQDPVDAERSDGRQ